LVRDFQGLRGRYDGCQLSYTVPQHSDIASSPHLYVPDLWTFECLNGGMNNWRGNNTVYASGLDPDINAYHCVVDIPTLSPGDTVCSPGLINPRQTRRRRTVRHIICKQNQALHVSCLASNGYLLLAEEMVARDY